MLFPEFSISPSGSYWNPRELHLCMNPNRKLSEMQFIINRLIHAASNDFEFVKNTLADLADIDEFWSKLVKVWLDSIDSEKEPFSLGLHRSDYLIETKGMIITL